ncbi:MAG: hypothetical protein ACP5UF_06110 [Hydrogenobaculum sp.]
MDKLEVILQNQLCTIEEAISKYRAFRKSKVIITTEFIKNLYYYADLFYKILTSTKYLNISNEEPIKDMAKALCYISAPRKRFPLLGYIEDYRLVKYIFKKHKSFIDSYLESNKVILSAF